MDLVLVLCPGRLCSAAHLCSCTSTAMQCQSVVDPFQHTFSTVFHLGSGLPFLKIMMSLHISGLSCEHIAWVETAWVLIAALCRSSFLSNRGVCGIEDKVGPLEICSMYDFPFYLILMENWGGIGSGERYQTFK